MAFIGASIQAVKGFADTILNKKRLRSLKELEQKDIFELIPVEKHLSAKILLKQTEYQNAIINNAERKNLSKIEKEIIRLMKENIEKKTKELKAKPASQYDIANLLLTIQKLSHETLEDQDKFTSNINKQISRMNKFVVSLAAYSLLITCCVIYLFTVVK
jgi:hypothetical protein